MCVCVCVCVWECRFLILFGYNCKVELCSRSQEIELISL